MSETQNYRNTSGSVMNPARTTTRITKMALMTALVSVSSYIVIPLPFSAASITAQTMVVNLIGLMFSPVDAALTLIAWILIGLAGVPVFSGGTAGFAKLLGPTGGYIISYIVVAFLIALFHRKVKDLRLVTAFLIIIGIPLVYLFGASWMKVVTGNPLRAILVQAVLPFIPLDIVKCIAAVFLYKALCRAGLS